MTSNELIKHFGLMPHPEGGWYKESYKSAETIQRSALPERFNGNRLFSTAIYFLLERKDFSAFHRIKSDECWHFYAGDPLLIYIILPDGRLDTIVLGSHPFDGQQFQAVVPCGSWFASQPAPGSEFSFVGCTVAPGFDFDDFEMGSQRALLDLYPQHSKLIQQLTRDFPPDQVSSEYK